MMRLILRRLLGALPNLVGVIVITFVLTRALPGDPAAYFAGGAATQEAVAQVRAQLGLDQPLPEQFLRYIAALARGDLGLSLTTGALAQDLSGASGGQVTPGFGGPPNARRACGLRQRMSPPTHSSAISR